MARDETRKIAPAPRAKSGWILLATVAAILSANAPAKAQGPHIPNMAKRSGLISRFAPTMRTNLPQDLDRDNFYGTRYGDNFVPPGRNSLFNGGLYGQRLDPGCTTCTTPNFYGAPGTPRANCPNCQPHYRTQLGRFGQGMLHQFKPVGSYYQQGCTVPIYDLDPIVPGPGYDLWPFFHNGHSGG